MPNITIKLIISLLTFAVMGCTPAAQREYDEFYGAGFTIVNETFWPANHSNPYPFTVSPGEIVCNMPHAGIGRQVYFMPHGYTDESYIGTPLNQAATQALKLDGDTSNVPYSIKKDADLSEAIQIGLRVCDEMQDFIDGSV